MDIIEIAKTKIKGERTLTFPLKIYMGRVSDHNGRHVLDIRGWGGLSYHEKGAEMQDGIGEWVVKTLNEAYLKELNK